MALGYKVRRTVQAYIDEAEYEQVVGVRTTFQKEDLGDVVQRANVLAAECLVSGGKRLGASATALVKVVSAQVDALAVTFGPDELALDPGLDAAIATFQQACRHPFR